MTQPVGLRRGAVPVSALAGQVARALAAGDEKTAWRLVLGFLDDFRGSSPGARAWLVADAPPPTGDGRYDALLAALVEHLCAEATMPVPSWTWDPSRIVEPWWFPSELPALEAAALRDSPISFKRHGVFITARALSRA